MNTSLLPVLTLLTLIAPVAAARAQQFSVPATTVPGVNHTYNTQISFGFDALVGTNAQVVAPNFTANLAAVNTPSWTISAPAGSQFIVQRPAGATSATLSFGGGWTDNIPVRGSAFFVGLPVFLTLADSTGSFTSNNLGFVLQGRADTFGFTGSLGVGATPVSFTALTVTADLSSIADRAGWDPQNYLGSVASAGTAGFGSLSFTGHISAPAGSADPGRLVTLAPIPEPSTTAALLAGAAALVVAGRRRTRHASRRAPLELPSR